MKLPRGLSQGCQTQLNQGPKSKSGMKLRGEFNFYESIQYTRKCANTKNTHSHQILPAGLSLTSLAEAIHFSNMQVSKLKQANWTNAGDI